MNRPPDVDFLEDLRRIRAEMHEEFKTPEALFQFLKAQEALKKGTRQARRKGMRFTRAEAAKIRAVAEQVHEAPAQYGRKHRT